MKDKRSSVHHVMEYDLISMFPNQYSQEHVDFYNKKEKSNLASKLTMFGVASALTLSSYFSGFNAYLASQANNLNHDQQVSDSSSENLTQIENGPNQELKDEIYEYIVAGSIFSLSYLVLNSARKNLFK